MEKIGQGAFGEVFVEGDFIYKKVYDKGATGYLFGCQRLLEEIGRYYDVGKIYSIEEKDDYILVKKSYVEGITLDSAFHANMDEAPKMLEKMAKLQVEINSVKPQLTKKYSDKIKRCLRKLDLPNENAIVKELDAMQEDSLCHGDYHPQNIIVDKNGRMRAIDWDNACMGDPLMDVCRTYLLLSFYEQYVGDAYLDMYKELCGVNKEEVYRYRKFIAVEFLTEKRNSSNKELLYNLIMT